MDVVVTRFRCFIREKVNNRRTALAREPNRKWRILWIIAGNLDQWKLARLRWMCAETMADGDNEQVDARNGQVFSCPAADRCDPENGLIGAEKHKRELFCTLCELVWSRNGTESSEGVESGRVPNDWWPRHPLHFAVGWDFLVWKRKKLRFFVLNNYCFVWFSPHLLYITSTANMVNQNKCFFGRTQARIQCFQVFKTT